MKKIANASIKEMYELFPEVIHYFETYVYPKRHNLLVSLRPDVFLFNHTTSQLGESYNNMIKSNMNYGLKHLSEIREHISCEFRIKHNLKMQKEKNSFVYHHFLIDQYNLALPRKICENIDIEITNLINIQIEIINEEMWEAKEKENTIYYLDFLNCNCRFISNAGIPCRHILALYRQTGNDFPAHLINPRFFVDYEKNKSNKDFIWPYQNCEEEEEEEGSEFICEEEYSDIEDDFFFESIDQSEHDYKIVDMQFHCQSNKRIQEHSSNQAKKYTELLQISKEICNIGSESQGIFDDVKNDLTRILTRYRKRTSFGEIVERSGRKKGRPRKKLSKYSRIKN